MKYLFLVLARDGSKRLVSKNTRDFFEGASLFDITYSFCKRIKNEIHSDVDILVSSDIPSINATLQTDPSYCFDYKRPKALSGDLASTNDTVIHCVEWYEKKIGRFDYCFLFQVTSPLRTMTGFNTFESALQGDCVFYASVSPLPFTSDEIILHERRQLRSGEEKDTFQSLALSGDLLFEDGAYYAAHSHFMKKNSKFVCKKNKEFVLSEVEEQIDVNTLEQSNVASLLYKLRRISCA